MDNDTFGQMLDRFIKATQEKALLENKLSELKEKLEPRKSITEICNEKLFLN